ncbi:helix-turn-helix domain-containing protein [Kutzneria sp. NPDC052558]|uniref:helix-turn-helix domain-containing protein n=1 Tax=Kutzneria sp. NPDC052558 TaxID=3364121 RepID=UPI0037CC30FC
MTEPTPPTLYLGPTVPRWQPRTIADVQAVLNDGLLAERHWLDAKREINASAAGKKDVRKELARDLASFANDGGMLIIGIDEDKQAGTFTLAPQSLDGVPEMIEQVVGHHCDPPLFVQCHRIVDPDDPGGLNRGVLIVEVPPSPLAPHMVDGKYHGRGDTVKRVLPDGEIARLHAVRRARQVTTQELIDQEIARDPAPAVQRDGVRLYAVAQPTASPPELLTEHLNPGALNSLIFDVCAEGADRPWEQMIHNVEPRATGFGWHSRHLRGRRWTVGFSEESDLEIADDGRLTLFAAGLSSAQYRRHLQQQFVRTETVLGMVRSLVQLAGAIGTDFGYAGRWELAVGVTGLAGLPADPGRSDGHFGLGELVVFSQERYVAGTMASTVELEGAPAAVTRRLMMRFARAFDMLARFETDDYLGRRREQADG